MTDTELRKLDAEIAVKVFSIPSRRVRAKDTGELVTICTDVDIWDGERSEFALREYYGPPRYSTDIAAAWQVVERMVETHMFRMDDDAEGRWIAAFTSQAGVRGEHHHASAPLAICRAALKVMSEDTR